MSIPKPTRITFWPVSPTTPPHASPTCCHGHGPQPSPPLKPPDAKGRSPSAYTASDIIEDAGFRTFQAEDGDAAMTVLAEHHASIVLLFTDVQMPGSRNGFAVARETAASYPHVAIVVASGAIRPSPGDMPEGARFIAKPFSAAMVHAHLQEILPDGQKPEPLRNAT